MSNPLSLSIRLLLGLLGAICLYVGVFFREDEDAEPMGAPVAVVSHGFWERQFGGNSRAIGSTLLLGNRQFTVIGVTLPRFTVSVDTSKPFYRRHDEPRVNVKVAYASGVP